MILKFTAIDTNAQCRNFFCQFTELEAALDFLGTVTLQGDTIIKAHILDENKRIELPPEAFDGQSFTEPIQELEKQWQAILSEPICYAQTDKKWYVDLTLQRIKLYDQKIKQIVQSIHQVELLWQRAEETVQDEQQRNKFINRYRLMLRTYHQQIDQMLISKRQVQKKLRQLERCHA